jgi:hypothetical protein
MIYILQLAVVLFGDASTQFKTELDLLIHHPTQYQAAGYFKKYEALGYSLSLDEIKEYEPEQLEQMHFVEFATAQRLTLQVDWKGEGSPHDVEDFLQRRLAALGRQKMDFAYVDRWETTIDWKSLKSGDFIVKKFVVIGSELAKDDLILANLQDGSDTYKIFLLTKKQFDATQHLSGEDRFFRMENIGKALKP